ncbi:stage IV sporulation protein A [Alloiococcus sp. CFN-8]|uniref:stage IV sporulation protein A n=1 Tax=Alloiococcus sp. CFN-8 TaxID=3416081 RepID=UPI003CFA1475
MDNFNIYKDIAERTQGDIYVGVVGPVRTGKSTFIKRFMDMMVIPKIENAYKKERAKDELPQSGSGKSIHTTEPKFVPNEAVEINIGEGIKFRVRLVDCVGYIVKAALGYLEGENPKMVTTPWFDYEIPFQDAAEIGTRKVINDHSTIGVLITTDGSIADIPRNEYVEAEERVVKELKDINKPFIVLLNSKNSSSKETQELRGALEEKYDVPVEVMDVLNMTEEDVKEIFRRVLKEFPVKEINIDMPEWIEKLEINHWLKRDFINIVKDMAKNIFRVRDIGSYFDSKVNHENLDSSNVAEMNMGEGIARVVLSPKPGIFYSILSELCSMDIAGETELLNAIKILNEAKIEYDKIADALRDVRETGYGMVAPQIYEMKFDDPEKVESKNKHGIKLKASAPSLHFIKSNIQTEITPFVGEERESEELVKTLLEKFDTNPQEFWQTNLFGKSLEVLVKEGLQNKLFRMPEDIQMKIQITLERIINEGTGGLICIIL